MASVVITGDTSGAITLAAPSVAGTNTITLPATTGTMALTNSVVSSATAGNGIAVSGATGAVTFSAACPTHNTVGSYCMAGIYNTNASTPFGNNFAASTSLAGTPNTMLLVVILNDGTGQGAGYAVLSGTWKWMAGNNAYASGAPSVMGIACRVS